MPGGGGDIFCGVLGNDVGRSGSEGDGGGWGGGGIPGHGRFSIY